MSKYVPDISTHRWVIVTPQRTKRPDHDDGDEKPRGCIFCEGHEKYTSNEVFRIGEGEPDTKGWQVRVIPNKYPITDFHEVIIHSPDHDKDIESLSHKKIDLVLQAYRHRYNYYREKGQAFIFCNHGMNAGASQEHPHSQLVVLPKQINMDTLVREPVQNIVIDNTFFIAYCPEFSQWPYEVWIAPKEEGTFFGDITDEETRDLAEILKRLMHRLNYIYEHKDIFIDTDKDNYSFGYNYYIYPKQNWYVRIIPRFVHRAGFELGTGLSVNVVDPIDAAEELKKQ